MIRPDWNSYFMSLLGPIASRSLDPNTQVGVLVAGPEHEVRATGYNSLPRGVEHFTERLERPEKYLWIEHAERNAIYAAAKVGTPLQGCTIYQPLLPCMDCARGIIQAGIVRVVYDLKRQDEFAKASPKWAPDFARVLVLLDEAGVAAFGWEL